MGSAWWQCAACLRAQEEDICELQLNHCNLYDVPPDVFIYERTLEELYLDANRIKDLPRPLFQCHELRVLCLSDNEITTLPPAIASLINLVYLDLSKNSIKELPDSIKECKNLRSIDISVNPFERFPDAITHIVGLRELYINDAYIEYLPANFGRLSALRTLELRENNMMTLPKSMSRLVGLQRLDIGNNDFTELPEVVGDLTNLTELWIDGNDIRRIPVNIEQLIRLNHFDCTMNAIHIVPSEIQGWRDISIMNFSSNEIYQLPDSICYLRTIVTLKIDDNQLNSLPDDIGQMSNLEELIVTKNFLEYLPSSLGLLRKLHCLNADNNYLRCLPPEIGSCTALSLLSLRSNNLSRIPPELGHLASLRVLNLVNNSIKFLPVSMLNLTNLKALWLSDNQSQPLVPLQQEFNCEEDIMVLSCFMLPQKPRHDLEQMEQPAVPIPGSVVGTGKRICFAAEVESEVPRQLHRAPTPYPKELRNLARHARNLHHQSAHDQRIHSEREIAIREAVVAKATATLSSVSKPGVGTSHILSNKNSPRVLASAADRHLTKFYNNNSSLDPYAEPTNSEESSDEANKTVIAKEKSPDIREAKYVRNPTSEYLAKQPTISDYVNSTWKPDEYSKTNTARIVESEKLAEPFRNSSTTEEGELSNRSSVETNKINEIPPAPPPYHIAAAFSKKAALFQQINHVTVSNSVSSNPTIQTSNSTNYDETYQTRIQTQDCPTMSPSPKNSISTRSFDENISTGGIIAPNGVPDDESRNISFDTVDPPNVASPDKMDMNIESAFDVDRSKPSRIPILRSIHLDGSNSDNDTAEKYANSLLEDHDRSKPISASSIPTSPITGKKYRSPLSSQPRLSDRYKKLANDTISNSAEVRSASDELNDSSISSENSVCKKNRDCPANKSYDDESPLPDGSCEKVQSESNSGRSTPISTDNKQSSNTNPSKGSKTKIPTLNDSPCLERRPRFKWMFGPHKNANVVGMKNRRLFRRIHLDTVLDKLDLAYMYIQLTQLPVRIRKNPGLGFSIAGGVAGNETGIIVTKVNPDGPAQGTLRPGDKILEVDGIDFTKSDHDSAVAVLRATGAVVCMMISRHQ